MQPSPTSAEPGATARGVGPRVPAYAQAAPEAALFGAAFGLLHAVAEVLACGLWGVRIEILDCLIISATCGLIGLGCGVTIWAIGLCLRRLAPLRTAWETAPGRRRFLGIGLGIFHTAVAWSIVLDQSDGVLPFAAMAAGGIVVAIALAVGYRPVTASAGSTLAALALVTANVAVVSWVQAAPDLPNARTMALAAGAWLLLPVVLILSVFVGAWRARSRAVIHGRGAVWVGAAVVVAIVLNETVFPLGLGWHVRHGASTSGAPATGKRPNVLLIVLDTVRADHLACFGYGRDTMPRLSQFGAESCRIAMPIRATAPATLAAHASMFTGHYSHTHGAHQPFLDHQGSRPAYGYPLRDDLPTLAETLGGLGYRTGGIAGNYAVLSGYGLSRGFDHYDCIPGAAYRGEQVSWLHARTLLGGSFGEMLRRRLPEGLAQRTRLFDRWAPPYRQAAQITDRATAWLSRQDARPFFLFLNYFDAHDPYVSVPQLRHRYVPQDVSVDWLGYVPWSAVEAAWRGEEGIPQAWLDRLAGLYDAELTYLDREIDRLLSWLRQSGRFDDTLIVILSDHGDAFMEHGLLQHATSLYDSQTLVPLFIKFPVSLLRTPERLPDHFQFVDLFPSVMTVVGGPSPEDAAGSPWAAGRDFGLAETFVHRQGIERLNRELCAVLLGPYKYIASTKGAAELYDLSADPAEGVNLIGTRPKIEARAREIINKRNATMVRESAGGSEDAALHQKLRSLGYTE